MIFFGLELLIPVAVLGLLVLAVTQVTSDRRDPDPTGRRPYAIYLFIVTFVALFVALFSLVAVASSVARLALNDQGSNYAIPTEPGVEYAPAGPSQVPLYEGFAPYDSNAENTRQAIQAGVFLVATGVVLLFHARRIRDLERSGSLVEMPVRRSYQAYLYAVCFVTVLTLLVAGALAVFSVVRIAAPGTTGFAGSSAERNDGIVQLVSSGVLALAAYGLFVLHWGRASALRDRPLQSEPPPVA